MCKKYDRNDWNNCHNQYNYKQQRKSDRPSFLDKKITKVIASAMCPGAGQFLDGREKTAIWHFLPTLAFSIIELYCRFKRGDLFVLSPKSPPKSMNLLNTIIPITQVKIIFTQMYSALEALFLSKDDEK